MDLNGDGHDDVISGSYWPGDLFVFWGKGDGKFEAGPELKNANGENLNAGGKWKSEDKPDMKSLASVPFAFDHDNDGDFDLLVGNIEGSVILIPNEGSKTEPKFAPETRIALKASGSELKVAGDSGPVVADWDDDGLPDLIVGAGDGAVTFFRNTGTRSAPDYAKGEALISGGASMMQKTEEPARPAARTKVCVTDYNNDGLLDLLVGDVSIYQKPGPDLTDEQIEERDALEAQEKELQKKMQELSQKIMQENEGVNPREIDWSEHEEWIAIQRERSELASKLSQYQGGYEYHGWVWLYLRKPQM